MYSDDNNKFNKSFIKAWKDEIKPYILQKYPVSKQGAFSANSDIVFMFDLIDKYLAIPKEEENNKNKNNEIEKKIIDDKQRKTSTVQKDIKTKIKKTKSDEKKDLKKQSKIYEENDIKILRKKNMKKISNFLEEFIKQNAFKKKRTNSMFNIRPHSQTINSITTCDDSTNIEDTNLNINQLIENNNKKEINENTKNINKNDINDFFKKNDIKEKLSEKEKKNLIRSKTVTLLQEMLPKYRDEEESKNENIKYNESNNELSLISVDLMLKKIIFEDFVNNNALLIYHFCQQCFCFVPKEIFFKKIVDCYHYYKKAKLGLNKLKNLVEFINILIVELFEYYEKINYKEVYVKVIKSFYYELINDILINYNENENNTIIDNDNKANIININNENNYLNNNETMNECNVTINKKNLIDFELNYEENSNNAIFLLKQREQEKEIEKEKETKKNKEISQINDSNASNDSGSDNNSDKKNKNIYENFKEDINNNNRKNYVKRNTVCFNENTFNTLSLTIKEKDNKKDSALKNVNKKQENKTEFKIPKNLAKRNSLVMNDIINIINEKSIKEEKSDDEDEKSNKFEKNNTILCKNNENLVEQIKTETKEEVSNKINNTVEEIFKNKEIISAKNEMLKKIRCILYLIDLKNGEDRPYKHEIEDAKKNISFYKLVDKLNRKKMQLNSIPRKRLTKTYSSFNFISGKPLDIKREYLSKGYFCITDWKTEEIGDKITEVTKSFLNKIHPREIYRGVFTKKEKEKTSPNVCLSIKSYNRLSSFVIEDVLSYVTLKDRVKVFDKWVQVDEYLKTKRNYNDCLAIYLALNNMNINMVQKELKTKTKNMLEQIGIFCSCLGNFRNIKEDMKQCEKTGEIFIPYLGLLLKEIININEIPNYSQYIEKGCINMDKIEKTNSIIEKYFIYKKKDKNNYHNIKELNFFYNLEDISEDDLEKIEGKKGTILDNKKLTNIDKKYFHHHQRTSKYKKRQTIASTSGLMYNGTFFIPSSKNY